MLKRINSTKSLLIACTLGIFVFLGCKTSELRVATAPNLPTDVSVNELTFSTVSLTWVAPKEKGIDTSGDPSTIREYKILYTKDQSFKEDVKNISITKNQVILDNLDPVTNYYVRVKSVNAVDLSSDYTKNTAFITLQKPKLPEAPSTIRIDKIENDEITISWDKPEMGSSSRGKVSKLKTYKIIYGKTIELEKGTEELTIDKETIKITGLEYGTKYYFKIVTISDTGLDSEHSDIKSFSVAKATYHTVTFDLDGGIGKASVQVAKNKALAQPKTPTKSGLSFGGWYSDSSLTTVYDFNTNVTSNITLYAKWNGLNQYTVSFNTNGGSTISNKTVNYNTKVSVPTNPGKANSTFVGWYSNISLTTVYDFNTNVTSNITLYAKWNGLNQYTVSFNTNGGNTISDRTVNYNTKVSAPTNPSKANSTFVGWYSNSGLTTVYDFNTNITSNITLYAKWNGLNQYTVSFNTNGGNTISDKTVNYNTKVSAPTNPSKTGHTFVAWYSNSSFTTVYDFNTNVTSDITLYAKWTINQYNVTFNSNGGTLVTAKTVNYNTSVPRPTAPTKSPEIFAGWYRNSSLTTVHDFSRDKVTGDITLYAKWTVSQHTVSFNTNGGNIISDKKVNHNAKVSAPTNPTKANNTFVGWYSNSGLTTVYDFNTNVTSNIALYAKWTVNQHTVSFNTYGGNTISDKTANHNTKVSAPTNPSKAGHTFVAWYSNSSLTTVYDFNANVTSDITLYAKWTINQYNVTFNSNGGTLVTAKTVDYDTSVPRPTDPTKSPEIFGGWYRNSSLTTVHDFSTDKITADITLYAKWNTNQYTVTFESNGGNTVSSKTTNYDTSITAPTPPTKSNSTFAGWYSDSSLNNPYDFSSKVKTNIRLYAKWTVNQHTVSFNTSGGNTISDKQVSHNAKVSAPTNPSKANHTFVAWYSDSSLNNLYDFNTNVTSDITLYAKWIVTQHTVSFNTNGGNVISDKQVNHGAKVSAPTNPSKSNNTFVGWYSNSGLTTAYDFNTNVTSDIILYAKWTVNQHTVSFNTNGGNAISDRTVNHNTKVSAPTNPSKSNNTFVGWYSNSGLSTVYDFNTNVTSDITLYAKWKVNQHTVSFNTNGGNAISDRKVNHNTKVSAPSNPSKANNTFVGWYSNGGLTTAYSFNTNVTSNITLYAKWTVNQHTVSFNTNGGNAISDKQVNHNTSVSKPTNPTQPGKTFSDWYSDSGLNNVYSFSSLVTTDITLYAKWTDSAAPGAGANGGISLITQNFWDASFTKRAGVGYFGQGYNSDFYSYQHFRQAISELSNIELTYRIQATWQYRVIKKNLDTGVSKVITDFDYNSANASSDRVKVVRFADFINGSDRKNNIRELCAFLANISKETNGGWSDDPNHQGYRPLWGLVFAHEVEGPPGFRHLKEDCDQNQYRSTTSMAYPPTKGKCYHGRGAVQLSWNYNYGQFSEFLYGDKSILINDPDLVSDSGVMALKSAIWFWMAPQGSKPSAHDVMQETWVPSKVYGSAKMNKKGFAHTNNVINGGLECRRNSAAAFRVKPAFRALLYKYYLGKYGVSQADIDAEDTGDYTTLCYENGDAMENY